jgi:hypothetical protein
MRNFEKLNGSQLKKTVYTCFFLLFLTNGYCQHFLDEETLKQEAEFEKIRNGNLSFIEGLADMLLLKGKKYFFRSSPLSVRRGDTNVLPFEHFTIIGQKPLCNKKYWLTWVVKNDSLFICNIKPFYFFWNVADENGKFLTTNPNGRRQTAIFPMIPLCQDLRLLREMSLKTDFCSWTGSTANLAYLNLNSLSLPASHGK